MVDARDKGMRAEIALRDLLRKDTGLKWERVPASGALSASHKLKGDLYIPEVKNKYCVEVKHYAEDQISTKILTDKNPVLHQWWEQTLRESGEVSKEPLLAFKHDRSKWFIGTLDLVEDIPHIYIGEIYISILRYEVWIETQPRFII
jgi:Holliday junction resolvase